MSVDTIYPGIGFASPTLLFNASTNANSLYVNVSVNDSSNTTAFIDFNRSLVLWMRFNNEAGENSTYVVDNSQYGNNASVTDGNLTDADGNSPPVWISNGRF